MIPCMLYLRKPEETTHLLIHTASETGLRFWEGEEMVNSGLRV